MGHKSNHTLLPASLSYVISCVPRAVLKFVLPIKMNFSTAPGTAVFYAKLTSATTTMEMSSDNNPMARKPSSPSNLNTNTEESLSTRPSCRGKKRCQESAANDRNFLLENNKFDCSDDEKDVESTNTSTGRPKKGPRLEPSTIHHCDGSNVEDSESSTGGVASTSHSVASNMAPENEITFDQAFDNFNIHPDERKELIVEYKRMMARIKSPGYKVQGIDKIKKTLADLQPMQDVIYLYVRFARQLPSNFHVDSICSLLCIARQCNYKPYVFLTKVKTLEVRKTDGNFGISFWFYTRRTMDVDGVLLDQKFLGLKLTLRLLQSTVPRDDDSELMYDTWVSRMLPEDRTTFLTFKNRFCRDAKAFKKNLDINVLIYRCTVGTFLSFPANLCYHATVTVDTGDLHASSITNRCHFRDLLIFYPMEQG